MSTTPSWETKEAILIVDGSSSKVLLRPQELESLNSFKKMLLRLYPALDGKQYNLYWKEDGENLFITSEKIFQDAVEFMGENLFLFEIYSDDHPSFKPFLALKRDSTIEPKAELLQLERLTSLVFLHSIRASPELCYQPNKRVQAVLKFQPSLTSIDDVVQCLRSELIPSKRPPFWEGPDPQVFLTVLSNLIQRLIPKGTVIKDQSRPRMGHYVRTVSSENGHALLRAEALADFNGPVFGLQRSMPPDLADAALSQLQSGLCLEDVVVPGIAVSGTSIQFHAVYLLPHNFPIMTTLTSEYDITVRYEEKMRELATWVLRCIQLAQDSVALLTARAPAVVPVPPPPPMRLNVDDLFIKPMRAKPWQHYRDEDPCCDPYFSFRLVHILHIYQRMSNVPDGADDVIILPLGVISLPQERKDSRDSLQEFRRAVINKIPSRFRELLSSDEQLDYRPLLLFPFLHKKDGWRMLAVYRVPKGLLDLFFTEWRTAVAVMNLARIAHLDLTPENIFWRYATDNDEVRIEIRVVDFEEAQTFDSEIPSYIVKAVCTQRDTRYSFYQPHWTYSMIVKASRVDNMYSMFAIRMWLESENPAWLSYRAFMKDNWQEVKQYVHKADQARLEVRGPLFGVDTGEEDGLVGGTEEDVSEAKAVEDKEEDTDLIRHMGTSEVTHPSGELIDAEDGWTAKKRKRGDSE